LRVCVCVCFRERERVYVRVSECVCVCRGVLWKKRPYIRSFRFKQNRVRAGRQLGKRSNNKEREQPYQLGRYLDWKWKMLRKNLRQSAPWKWVSFKVPSHWYRTHIYQYICQWDSRRHQTLKWEPTYLLKNISRHKHTAYQKANR